MAIIERIVTVYNDKGSKQALKDLKNLENNFANAGKKIAKAFGAATLAAGALATKLAVDGVQAAIADQKSQALLANSLRNTVGASESAIASVEDYISTQQKLVKVTDEELRPSLTTLLNATKDITTAQALQSLALDISAGSQKDLQTVSMALAKAIGGNFSALTKLGVPLSENIKKSKDLNGAFKELSATFGGAAATRAETFEYRMNGLRIAFGEALETLGYALIPVLENLAQVFETQLIPVFEQFIANNKDDIAKTLGDVITFAINAAKALAGMFKTISENLTTFKVFAGILTGIFVGTKVYAGVMAIAGAIIFLTKQFQKQAVAGTAAGTATAFATGGTSALAAAAGLTAFAAAAGVTWLAINKLTGGIEENTSAFSKNSQVVNGHLKDLARIADATKVANLNNVKNLNNLKNLNKKTAAQILLEKTLAALKAKGVTPTSALSKEEQEAINLEAARLNLIKQGNLEQARRVEELQRNFEAQMKVIEATQKYIDILQVLADSKISDQEILVLAQKWNMTAGQVTEYIARIYAANSTETNDSAIIKLYMAWGLTREEAEKYVDFTRALKDEKLDPSEIEKLMGKWQMTRQQVLDYAKQVQAGTVFSGTWDDPGKAAELSWIDALAALNAYIAAAGNIPKIQIPPIEPIIPVVPISPNGKPNTNKKIPISSPSKNPAITNLNKRVGDIVDEIDSLYYSQMGINPFDSQGSNPSISNLAKRTGDFSAFDQNTNGVATIVNVTVQGSVTSENDLVTTIRDSLLTAQGSGSSILYDSRIL